MKIKPLNNRVLIERIMSEEITPGGIYIPDAAKEKPAEGVVLAVGPGSGNIEGFVKPMAVKVGDMVLFTKYGGTDIKIDNKELIIMSEDDILGIVE